MQQTDSNDVPRIPERERIGPVGLVWSFFFRPSVFMHQRALRIGDTALFVVVWYCGISMALQVIQSRPRLLSALSGIDSWVIVLIIAVFLGPVRGWIVYGIGGFVYRLRLRWSGVKDEPWPRTGRVYFSAGIAKHTVYLCIIPIAIARHDAPSEWATSMFWTEAALAFGVYMLFEIWASFTLYYGTRSVFPVRDIPALIWFLILPLVFRLLQIALWCVILVFGSLGGFAEPPDLTRVESVETETFRFEYPSNWVTEIDEVIPGPEYWFTAEPVTGIAFLEVRTMYTDDRSEPMADHIRELERTGYQVNAGQEPLRRIGRLSGEGELRQADYSGSELEIRLLCVDVDEDWGYLVTIVSARHSWPILRPGFEHILNTLEIVRPEDLEPNIHQPYPVRSDEFRLLMPSNWWLHVEEQGSTTAEDGRELAPWSSTEITSPGLGSWLVSVYTSESGTRAELGATISMFTDEPRLIDEEALSAWRGINGIGVRGGFAAHDGTESELMVFLIPLNDGRLLEIRRVITEGDRPIHLPGYERIESSFELLAEPAP